ncbi:sigma-54 interaction domain-containing protein [Desulfobulbus alkaliphilus]|uniref:sigma-54 interaction domain-containing protein n=1 Tax=Desulfobulbus alkaliphilus TaxID=869814 RepID=UPI0019659416|nr:sigma-54 dependent transcriptional regulator [Desulfobulbus alkaliphilus]MBM9537446.1 sigma-54-dependent Fis family transcriptional regulator [Desulfobulbus alkaliphilus]
MAHNSFCGIIGRSEPMQRLFKLIEKLAEDSSSTVLVQGESGTGKELVAKAIHANSPRSGHHFVPVNCAAIPDDLLESELFGYTKGAFTGATGSKIGRIEYANGGSLFLDEIGDMKPVLQAKLLRVLQEREFEPVGGLKPIPVDVRIIAATHCNLEQMVAEGKFREDLYYRLNVIPVFIPPLRNRPEDIPLLIEHFIKAIGKNKKKALTGFDLVAMKTLTSCPWKGNVRELENLIQHMTILHGGCQVCYGDLPEKYQHGPGTPAPSCQQEENGSGPEQLLLFSQAAPALHETWPESGIDFNGLVNDFETRLIVQALKMAQGNKKEAARLLNLKRTTLLEKIKKKELFNTGIEEGETE